MAFTKRHYEGVARIILARRVDLFPEDTTSIMTKPRKFDYLFIIQGAYGQGWEDVNAETTRADARRSLREYRENEPQYPHRMIQRRELREGGTT